jgi:hypothetical protein
LILFHKNKMFQKALEKKKYFNFKNPKLLNLYIWFIAFGFSFKATSYLSSLMTRLIISKI